MKLLICMITFNRLAYSQRTLKSLEETIDVPYELIIVDNNSTDGTQKWLEDSNYNFIINPENFYPGRACNIGWATVGPDITHLMRLDNDMEFNKGWATRVDKYFNTMPMLGQLGLDFTALDGYSGDQRYLTTVGDRTINAWPGNVGGPCVITRAVYDKGARYDETPWMDLRLSKNAMITPQEDVKFSLSMHNYKLIYGHPTEKLAWTFANAYNRDDYPDYYKKTMSERGYQ